MTKNHEADEQRYVVSVFDAEGPGAGVVFTFTPAGNNNEHGVPLVQSQFMVAAKPSDDGIAFDWSGTPNDPKSAKIQMEKEAEERMRERVRWIRSVESLVDTVEDWAAELEWSTRRIEKKLDDGWIGTHRVPALLMQEDTCRVLLEPVGRSAPGVEGVVDLYLLPAYDDIATLYYYDNRWHLHHAFPDVSDAATAREAQAVALSKEALAKVLAEMRQNAA
ncbi:MAG TPA: hypothetical protein VJ783_01190 [Pirellulales bacterium]|nr:hypothetical protein [Pirellulales bacterium]